MWRLGYADGNGWDRIFGGSGWREVSNLLDMNLMGVVGRRPVAEPWVEGEKIPWNEPEFSRRMLAEHLTQSHDAASRRLVKIDRHVDWIHRELLAGEPTRVLDLGCGPGLYTSRLAGLGHECVGVDISPASVEYATARASECGLRCSYVFQDMRTAEYGAGYGLVMLIFGEFNVFRRRDARTILEKAHAALSPGGVLLLEPHTFDAVREMGERGAHWYSADRGVFSDEPYLCLRESFWHPEHAAATERYYVIDAATGGVTRYASSMQAYTDAEYRRLLAECGFGEIAFHAAMGGGGVKGERGLMAIAARRGWG